MNKKELKQDLIERGFNVDKYGALEKEFGGNLVKVSIYSGLFSKRIKMIGIFYKFKKELEINFHQEVFDKAIECLDGLETNLKMGALGFDFIESSITDKDVIKKITGEEVENNCVLFVNTIIPLVKEYDL